MSQRSTLNALRWLALLCLAPLAAACDPCFGVLSCGDPRIRYEGRLVERHSGQPARGVRVEFVPRAGVGLGSRTLATRTDSLGRFSFQDVALAEGQVVGRMRAFFADSVVVDSLDDVRLATSPTRADSRSLGQWAIRWPHFESVGNLYYRATRAVVRGAEVEFRRTGGIAVDPDTFVVFADSFGNFPLRPRPLQAGGVLIGDLIVRPRPPFRADTIRGVRVTSYLGPDPEPLVARWGIGPHLPYVGTARYEGTGARVVGVQVEIVRTGGIPVSPDRYTQTTNELGDFSLGPAPLDEGEVHLDITFRPPAPYRTVTYPYTLRTTREEGRVVLVETWVIPRQ